MGPNYHVLPTPVWLSDNLNGIFNVLVLIWVLFFVIQFFLAFGTAYRCTKNGNDNGLGLFLYLIGFWFAAIIPGLGLHYYIRHLSPKLKVVKQVVQPQVVKIVEQTPSQQVYTQTQQTNANMTANQSQGNYTPEQLAYMRIQQEQLQKENAQRK